jgi:branched-chain amino acid transport system ATP-binding protein
MLDILNLEKQFGGIKAVDNVNLHVKENEIHAIIGPNGAGKTTLVSQVAGELMPDAGQIRFMGTDITFMRPAQRARKGLARSFQITSVMLPMTLLENVSMAVQSRKGHSFGFWRAAANDRELIDEAMLALDAVGLSNRADRVAKEVSHGEHRQLEIAMAIAMEPRLLLLDEPMAGMGQEESMELVAVLNEIKKHKTILLIEHDMDAVFSLADQISVLVYGKIIATGGKAEIRANPEVQQAYLGES